MKPFKIFGCRFFALLISFAVIQACGTNHDVHPTPVSGIPSPVSCDTSGVLPCFLVEIDPTQVEIASLSLKDPNGTTTAIDWQRGKATSVQCSLSDPNGFFLYLTQPGAYSLAINANGYQPTEIDFTLKTGECGSAPCTQTCLQTNPAPLQATLTASP